MVCSTAILTSSLALSLLRLSSNSSESFVLSPFSLNSALSVIHDGAVGMTQQQLTRVLLKGCTPSDVTEHFSSLTLLLAPKNETEETEEPEMETNVEFKIANRFYVNDSISLKEEYQKHVEDKYKVQVVSLNLSKKEAAAAEMNAFIEQSTNGKIRNVVKPATIKCPMMFINAIYFKGKWAIPFSTSMTHKRMFTGDNGEAEIDFMTRTPEYYDANLNNEFGTAVVLPYEDDGYRFFYLMPKNTSSLENMRNELTGEKLIDILQGVQSDNLHIFAPKFVIESELDGVDVLKQLGVKQVFRDDADLSKISSTSLKVSGIRHSAMIEMNEVGTEAAAVTRIVFSETRSAPRRSTVVIIDRPFLFGILRNDDILFIGQFTGK